MFENFRIGAALLNVFHLPITDNAYADQILTIIEEIINSENNLAEHVIHKNINRQGYMAANLPQFADFSHLEEEHLILIALVPPYRSQTVLYLYIN